VAEQLLQAHLLRPAVLAASAAVLGCRPQLDDVQVGAYPAVGIAHNEPGFARAGGSDIHVWHRDSHNTIGVLLPFHVPHAAATDHASSGSSSSSSSSKTNSTPLRPPAPPAAVNFITYLQPSRLRVVPGSHRRFEQVDYVSRCQFPAP
jgi:hypothetical protein